jgi:hypothetical protein
MQFKMNTGKSCRIKKCNLFLFGISKVVEALINLGQIHPTKGESKMLFFVKVRVDMSKLVELGQKMQRGEFKTHPMSTYCLKEDPSVGLNIWEAADLEDFKQKFAPHREYYSEVFEITPVLTAVEAQQVLMKQIKGV